MQTSVEVIPKKTSFADSSTYKDTPMVTNVEGIQYGVDDVQEVPQPDTAPKINLEPKVESPTVISTDSMRNQLSQAEKSLLDMKAQIEAGNLPQEENKEAGEKTIQTPPPPKESVDDGTQFLSLIHI